ncbi:hypothetical protein HWV00_21375 (plasmid) [Moritella sp. 24]|uniref:hypothetical protein n=1 Tax=Moritella sp. 24 TaxID=2746230 RepID=UPI001BAA9DF1|nr:hypothetical protein [Moritella sp. 24]QUM78827.1 hypothetical protein HWV00_21375 [Moritella sp. 24]
MVRKNGHYWVSVKTSNGIRREVALWVNDMWFVSGCGEYEMERDTYEISNVDEEMITEKQT